MYEPGSIPTTFPKELNLKQPIGDKNSESPLIKKPKEHFENNFFKNKANVSIFISKEKQENKFEGSSGIP